MKNVTISMDDETARWVRVRAAELDVSISKYLAQLVEKERVHDSGYAAAMAQWLAQEPFLPGGRIPTREELHERPGIR